MKSPEFEVTPTGETQPEVKALLVSGALYIVITIFWLPGHQVNITLKKLSWRSHPATTNFFVHPFQKLKTFSDHKAEFSNFVLL